MLFYIIWPILLALVPIAFKLKRLRFALLWITLTYVIFSFVVAIIPVFLMMIDTGKGDPQLVAGQISQSLVTSMLLAIIHIPLALVVFWTFKKFRT